jgi:CheY-like chemotaxis protein
MKKVLVVDNVRSILEREKGLLNRDSFLVFSATSGEEALEVHKKEKVDIIIMDLDMPNMPGDEVCRAIRADDELKKVSIILATIYSSADEAERCKAAGANACIKKPINKDELAEKMATLLGVPARQAIRILVKVKVEGRIGSDFFIANTVDVSVTGLLFECDRELGAGDMVEASFFLPGNGGYNRVVVKSQLMRSVPSEGSLRRYGVKFTEFVEGTPEQISEFIEKKTGKH